MGEMPPGPVKVTVTDPVSGEVLGERTIEDDYILICNGRSYLAHTTAHANGTHVLTVKQDVQQIDGDAGGPS